MIFARRARTFVGRCLRVAVYLLALSIAGGALAARTAHAEARRGALAFGEQLLRLSEAAGPTTHELSINGQVLRVGSAQTSLPLAAVLDRFHAACNEHADGMAAELNDLEGSLSRGPATQEGFPGIGVLRDVRDGRGVVACFAAGGATTTADLAHRLERFAETTDLGELGGLRYVAARTLEGGGTLVVATWTDGRLRLGDMFPEHGDAAGEDPAFAPRPDGQRVLSARDLGAPYGVYVYRSGRSPAGARAAYAAAAERAGFHALPAVNARSEDTQAFERSGVDILVVTEAEDTGAVTTVIEMPENGKVSR